MNNDYTELPTNDYILPLVDNQPLDLSPSANLEYSAPRYTTKKELDAEFKRAFHQHRKIIKDEERKQVEAEERQEQEAFENANADIIRKLADSIHCDEVNEILCASTSYDFMWLAVRFWVDYGDSCMLMMQNGEGKWYVKSDGDWKPDHLDIVKNQCRGICTKVIQEGGTSLKKATIKRLNDPGTWSHMRSALETLPGTKQDSNKADSRPDCFGIPGGVYDMRSGKVHPADKDNLTTMSVAAIPKNPTAASTEEQAIFTEYIAFINRICCNDSAMVEALRWHMCYSLTGYTLFHKFFYLQGLAGTGKSAAVKTLGMVAGDYAVTVAASQFLEGNNQHATYDHRLKKRRIWILDEFKVKNSHHPVDAQKIFDLCSGGKIVAGAMRQDPTETEAVGHLWITSNDRPDFANEGNQLRRRLVCYPFHKVKPAAVPQDKFKKIPGLILYWILESAPDVFQAIDSGDINAFPMPEAIKNASESWADSQDEFQDFLNSNYSESPTDCDSLGMQPIADIKALYEFWIADNEVANLGANTIGNKLQSKGYKKQDMWVHGPNCYKHAKCARLDTCKKKTVYLGLYLTEKSQRYETDAKALWVINKP
jgi:P4 family phage/plasmid primase-like protien